jgi:hypothetical protein
MVVDLCLINISATEQISFTDQPRAWNRKGIRMNNQLWMNMMLDDLMNWPVGGGMKGENWSLFMH